MYVCIVLFQAIQFNMSTQFSTIWPKLEPYQVLPLRVRVDLGAIETKGYSAFPKL